VAFEVTVPVHAHELIRKIAHASQESRDELANALMERPVLGAPTALAALLKQTIAEDWPGDEVYELVSQIFGMSMLLKRGHTPETAAKSIAEFPALELDDGESAVAASVLANILSSRSAMDLASAVAVYSDFDHVLSDVQVHADVRTVFDLFEHAPAGGIVTRKLRISYGSDAGPREFEVALDLDAVKKLRRALDRAEEDAIKTSALYTAANLPIYSFDDED
jgi:hypothetical protein